MRHILTTRSSARSGLARFGLAGWVSRLASDPAGGLANAQTKPAPIKLTLFGQPSVNNDLVWMAIDQGLLRAGGTGRHLPAVPVGHDRVSGVPGRPGRYHYDRRFAERAVFLPVKGDYRTIAVVERDSKGYVAVAGKDIKTPQDLAGKTVATRVGSTGSWFISEYLIKNHVDPETVTVKNLDTQVLPAALCGGDIAAFFIWQPVGSRTLEICPDKAHYLTDATGYIQGYLVAGARPEWLATPEGKDTATRWLRATIKGRDVAAKDFNAVAAYAAANLGLSEKATKDQWDTNMRPLALDKVYYSDFCSLGPWGRSANAIDDKIDFTKLTWSDGLKAIDPKLVDPPPPPC